MPARFRADLLAFAALSVCVGACGGSGSSSPTVGGGGVSGNLSTPVLDSTSTSSVTSPAGTETPVTLTVNGVSEVDAVPGGESIAAGGDVLLIPNNLPLGIDSDPSSANPSTPSFVPGEIYLRLDNGTVMDTGLMIRNQLVVGHAGTRYPHYVFAYPPSGSYRNLSLFVKGPCRVGVKPFLEVSDELDLSFQISRDSILGPGKQSTYPTSSLYALPADGQSMFESFLRLNLGRLNTTIEIPAGLTMTYPGVTKTQTRDTTGGPTTLWDAANDSADLIPTTGITSAKLTVQAP